MMSLAKGKKLESLANPLRPWLVGIPTFFVVMLFLDWVLARIASWIFAVLLANK